MDSSHLTMSENYAPEVGDRVAIVSAETQKFLSKEQGTEVDLFNIIDETIKGDSSTAVSQDRIDESIEQTTDSNPECDIEIIAELPLDDAQTLPKTVTVLEAPNGGKVYVVGTAHFSLESQEDVAKVINMVKPHVVMVELCEQRTSILLLDEATVMREAKDINIQKVRKIIRENGVLNGLMYVLLLNMSAHITKELGMAPGGEFRRALLEAKKQKTCVISLGDRPIDITLQRAIASLSYWQTVRFVWHLLMSNSDISAEEVEKCKQKAQLEAMLEEMATEFPSLKQILVLERDRYLAHSLQLALKQNTHGEPCRVVGVVGMGHVAGIAQNWMKVSPQDIPPLLKIPPPTRTTRMVRACVKISFAGAVVYVAYRLIPKRWIF